MWLSLEQWFSTRAVLPPNPTYTPHILQRMIWPSMSIVLRLRSPYLESLVLCNRCIEFYSVDFPSCINPSSYKQSCKAVSNTFLLKVMLQWPLFYIFVHCEILFLQDKDTKVKCLEYGNFILKVRAKNKTLFLKFLASSFGGKTWLELAWG